MYQWIGNVGLVNVSDVLKASTNIACTSATDEYNAIKPGKETCGSYLTYFDTINEELGGIGYWTMNEFYQYIPLTRSYDPRIIGVWTIFFSSDVGGFGDLHALTGDSNGVRPVVFLKSSIQITAGDGTKSNPYIIQ